MMETLEYMSSRFKGYQHVADFQKLCGVDIVELPEFGHTNGGIPNGCNGTSSIKNGIKTKENGLNGTVTNGLVNGVTHRTCSESNGSVSINGSLQNEITDKNTHKNGCTDNSYKNGIHNSDGNETRLAYKIKNKFLYYLFLFGAGLGGEYFYIVFFPFMFWNVDSRLTRQLVLIWYPLMYIGQFLKDLIKLPRPGPPAVRLEGKRFEMEYGFPSTHTIVGTCIPFSLLIQTSKVYEYPFELGLLIAIAWTLLVATSRVYLGMHTVMDCIAGVSMTAIFLPGMLSVIGYVDYTLVTNPYAPWLSFLVPLLACIYYPKPEVWSITRGDTSNIVSIGSCIMIGSWFNYHMGWMTESPISDTLQPIPAITSEWMTGSLLRTVIGVVALAVSRIVSKKVWLKMVCDLSGVDHNDIARQRVIGMEVPVRWLTIGGLAINTSITLPLCFYYLGILRPGFYSEVGL